LSVEFEVSSSIASDTQSIADDWTKNGELLVITQKVKDAFRSKNYGISRLTPTVCRKI
jgi:hypothetical protein